MSTFKKFDGDKPKLTYLSPFMEELGEVAKVIEHGAKKYGLNNWRQVDEAELERYYGAILRHGMQMVEERHDGDSGLEHAAHIITSCLFVLKKYRDFESERETTDDKHQRETNGTPISTADDDEQVPARGGEDRIVPYEQSDSVRPRLHPTRS